MDKTSTTMKVKVYDYWGWGNATLCDLIPSQSLQYTSQLLKEIQQGRVQPGILIQIRHPTKGNAYLNLVWLVPLHERPQWWREMIAQDGANHKLSHAPLHQGQQGWSRCAKSYADQRRWVGASK